MYMACSVLNVVEQFFLFLQYFPTPDVSYTLKNKYIGYWGLGVWVTSVLDYRDQSVDLEEIINIFSVC